MLLLLDTHLAALYFQSVAQVLDFFAAPLCRKHATVLVTLTGRGDKDADQIAERLTRERIA